MEVMNEPTEEYSHGAPPVSMEVLFMEYVTEAAGKGCPPHSQPL